MGTEQLIIGLGSGGFHAPLLFSSINSPTNWLKVGTFYPDLYSDT
jgi:hypothetical protein